MASSVDISNIALSHVFDEATVISIDPPDGSAQAAHCGRFYPIARDACLESHAWRFAKTRKDLAVLDDDHTPGSWTYAYSLPAGLIAPLALLLPESTDDAKTQPYEIEIREDTGNMVLYTHVEDAELVYIKRVTDTTKFTPLFVDACAWLLAHYLAGPIAKNPKLAEYCFKMHMMRLGMAQAADANARQNDERSNYTPSHIKARGGSSTPIPDAFVQR